MSIIFYISDSYYINVRFRSIGLQTPLNVRQPIKQVCCRTDPGMTVKRSFDGLRFNSGSSGLFPEHISVKFFSFNPKKCD